MKREGECIDQSAKRIETEIPGTEVQACISDDDQTLKELGSAKKEEGMADKVNARHQLKVWISAKHIYQKDFDKFLKKLEISFVKSKKAPKTDYAIITFATDADKVAGAKVLEVAELKGKSLTVADHAQIERSAPFKSKDISNEEDSRTPLEKIADQVTPLWRKSYQEQLQVKQDRFKKVLRSLKSDIYKLIPKRKKPQVKTNNDGTVSGVPSEECDESKRQQLEWIKEKVKENDGFPCALLDIIPSPVEKEYRNKCEFTFGKDIDGNPTVGFLLGLFKEGYSAVISPDSCLHVSEPAKQIAKSLEKMTRESKLPVYDRITQQGFWRLAQVRTFTSGENSILLQVNSSGFSDSDIEESKTIFLKTVKEMPVNINSCYFQIWDGVFNGFKEDSESELLMGSSVIHENLLDVKFQVSPQAFFQVNTPATETLFSVIKDWVLTKDVSPENVVLLDLCCGTGTIGIALSSHFKKVIGVEMVQDAIKDAQANAELNGILERILI